MSSIDNSSSYSLGPASRGATVAGKPAIRVVDSIAGDTVDSSARGEASRMVETLIPQGEIRRISLPKITADVVADLILDFCRTHGDLVTNLKLQKLVYYSQAWFLAIYEKPLFPQKFQAGIFGPIQPELFAKYKRFDDEPIRNGNPKWDVPKYISQHIADVMEAYGGLSAFDLERLACSETPWKEARGDIPYDADSTAIIDETTMKKFYMSKINGQETAKTKKGN